MKLLKSIFILAIAVSVFSACEEDSREVVEPQLEVSGLKTPLLEYIEALKNSGEKNITSQVREFIQSKNHTLEDDDAAARRGQGFSDVDDCDIEISIVYDEGVLITITEYGSGCISNGGCLKVEGYSTACGSEGLCYSYLYC